MYQTGIPLVVVDIETAGLKVEHPIIQIAAVVVETGTWVEKETFEVKLQFKVEEAIKEALEVNHFSPEAWKDAVPPGVAIRQFSRLLERHRFASRISKAGKPYQVAVACGYNSSFDSERLFYQARLHNIFLAVDPRFLDVMQLAFWRQLTLKSYKLTSVAEELGISTANAHDALADVRMTIEVLKRLR